MSLRWAIDENEAAQELSVVAADSERDKICIMTGCARSDFNNAYLISAAPEMLSLLKDTWRYLRSIEEGLPPGCPMPERFEQVFDKAEGREP